MITVDSFTFNPFQENTYILHDETKQCVIIDPGCYTPSEKDELIRFIEQQGLMPVKLLNTHCHIDHMLGNKFIADKFALGLEMHKLDLPMLHAVMVYGEKWGLFPEPSPDPVTLLEEGDVVTFGNSSLKVLFTPGHSPGSISFYSDKDRFVIAGDVLFFQSIGRTDLPGGDFDTLAKSIKERLYVLEGETKIYPGHGPATTIAFEKQHNPFVR